MDRIERAPRGALSFVTGLLCLFAGLAPTSDVAAQTGTPYAIAESEGVVSQGCLPPSPCDCAVFPIYTLFAQFELTPLPPSLGPIFEYTIDGLEGAFVDLDALIFVEGSGTYTIDTITGTHGMVLDLMLFGTTPVTYSSFGMVDGGGEFPVITIDVARDLDGCTYEGLHIVARPVVEFIRGDANEDGTIDLGDAIASLPILFPTAGPIPIPCEAALDANSDGIYNLADPVYVLAYLFTGGAPPAPPFPACAAPTFPPQLPCDEPPDCP